MQKYCPKCSQKYPDDVDVCPDDKTKLVLLSNKDLVGEVLDNRYAILGRIGEGGMGVVYRAEHQMLKRVLALKVLRGEIGQDENMVKRFMTEARAIASLDSRHTVTVHDFGVTDDGLLYYTMELLEGRSLSKVIRDESPLDPARAVGLMCQACDSMREAHERNILHRDIKSDNLFVTEKNGQELIKVLDFGIAKLMDERAADSITMTGMIVGTPNYLSPEQALGDPVSPASDLYSLAVVLYEMLTGMPPFQSETPTKMILAHVTQPAPSMVATNPDIEVSPSLERFLARALQKDPANRFSSASQFAVALKTALDNPDSDCLIEDSAETIKEIPVPPPNTPSLDRALIDEVTQDEDVADPEDFGEAATMMTPTPAALTARIQQISRDTGIPIELAPIERAEEAGPAQETVVSAPKSKSWQLWAGIGVTVAVAVVVLVLVAPWKTGDESKGEAQSQRTTQSASANEEGKAGGPAPDFGTAEAGGGEAGKSPEAGAPDKGAGGLASETKQSEKVKVAAEAKAEAEAEAEARARLEAQAKAEAEAQAKAEAEAQAKAEAEAKAQADAEAQIKAQADAEAQAQAKAQAKARAEAEAKADAKAKAEAEAKADAQAKAEAEAQAQADAEAQAKAQKVADLVAKGNAAKRKGKYADALKYLKKARKLEPGNAEVGRNIKECEEEIKALEELSFDGKKPSDGKKPKEDDGLDDLKFD